MSAAAAPRDDASAGEALVRRFIVESPLGRLLGVRAERIARDEVVLRLGFRPELTTLGDLVHGGALAALIDTAATAAAWSGLAEPAGARGTTVDLHVSFLAGARGCDVLAHARILRRGRSLVVCDVEVADARGEAVAKALVTYKLDPPR